MTVKHKRVIAAASLAAGLAAVALAAPAQAADPGTPTNTALVAVGSDTTQDVMDALSNLPTMTRANGTRLIDNYLASGSATITTRSNNANCSFTRPVGSGNGANALSAAMQSLAYGGSAGPINNCVNIVRSSSGGAPSNPALPAGTTITMIPFATDTVTYAVRIGSTISRQLATAQLTTYYSMSSTDTNCLANPSHGPLAVQPLLPQAGSGTRSFFLSSISVTTPGSCVKDTDAAGNPILENTGTYLSSSRMLIPFSVGQWKAQQAGVTANQTSQAMLGSIGGIFSAGYDRNVYNGVPTASITTGSASFDQDVVDGFVGANSKVCQAVSTITKYGFGANPTCGVTTKTVP